MNPKDFHYFCYNEVDELYEFIPSHEKIEDYCEFATIIELYQNFEEFMFDEDDIGKIFVVKETNSNAFTIFKMNANIELEKVC